jgi:hypothetical protein
LAFLAVPLTSPKESNITEGEPKRRRSRDTDNAPFSRSKAELQMTASTRRRFQTGGLRPTIRLFLPGPRLPVISGGRILAGKTYRGDFRAGNLAEFIQSLNEHLNIRRLPSEVPVEEISQDALTSLQMKCNVAAVVEGFFKNPTELIR